MFRGRTLHCAAGMCFSGRDLGNIQPFQHKMFLSCVDNTSVLSCSQKYESSVKHENIYQVRAFLVLYTAVDLHVIKHPVITHLEKSLTPLNYVIVAAE